MDCTVCGITNSWTQLSDFHFHCIIIKDLIKSHLNGLVVSPISFKPEFCNKEPKIWATVTSRICFYWQYRASPFLAEKKKIDLISVLTIWWCPCVELSLVLLEESVCYDQCVLLTKVCYFCPASFCISRPNFLLLQISFDFLFCIPIPQDVKDIFTSVLIFVFHVSPRKYCGSL